MAIDNRCLYCGVQLPDNAAAPHVCPRYTAAQMQPVLPPINILVAASQAPLGHTETLAAHQMHGYRLECEKLREELRSAREEIGRKDATIATLNASAADAWLYSHEWMKQHDQLLGWIQERRAVFKEFCDTDPRGPSPSPERIAALRTQLPAPEASAVTVDEERVEWAFTQWWYADCRYGMTQREAMESFRKWRTAALTPTTTGGGA